MSYGIIKSGYDLEKVQNILDAAKSLAAAGDSGAVKDVMNKLADEIKAQK